MRIYFQLQENGNAVNHIGQAESVAELQPSYRGMAAEHRERSLYTQLACIF